MRSFWLFWRRSDVRRVSRGARSLLALGAVVALVLAGCGAAAPLPPGGHPRLTSIFMLSPTEGFAAGEGGAIVHYAHGRWDRVDEPTGVDLNGIAMTSPTEGWAVGLDPAEGKGIILHSSGGRWQVDTSLATPALRAITLVSPTEGWAVGDGGTMLHLTGDHWIKAPSPTTADLMAITMLSPAEGWATGYNLANTPSGGVYTSVILHFAAGQWSEVDAEVNARYYGIAATAKDSWLVGSSAQGEGTILYGVRDIWTPAGGYIPNVLTGVALVAPAEGWATGYKGAIVHMKAGSWTLMPVPTRNDLFGIAMLSPTEGWAVGDQSVILHFHDGAWRVYGQ